MRHYIIIFLSFFLFGIFKINAQNGGTDTYEFLDLTYSARVAALGGSQIAVKDNDPNFALGNPALLNRGMDNQLTLNYINYFEDINFGYVSYTKHVDTVGTFNLGVNYVNYGKFIERDAGSNEVGTFNSGEYAIVMGYGRDLNKYFSVGANLKTIFSNLYQYNSFGMAVDLGATYYKAEKGFTASLVFKNIGTQIVTYDGEREPIPFEIQAGISKRLENVPIRLSLTAHSLETPDLSYDSPNEKKNVLFGEEETEEKNQFLDKVARHAIFGVEFVPSENFNIRLGYNYQRRKELLIEEKTALVGFSAGFGIRISKFHFSYGWASYHQAGALNSFSIVTRISDFYN